MQPIMSGFFFEGEFYLQQDVVIFYLLVKLLIPRVDLSAGFLNIVIYGKSRHILPLTSMSMQSTVPSLINLP